MYKIFGLFDSTKDIKSEFKENFIIDQNIAYLPDVETYKIEKNKIFFSGKLYNRLELEKEYNISSNSDSELILNLYLNHDFNSLKKLNGEFTIIIITLFETIILRDKNGCDIPIYYTEKFFSSTLQSLIDISKIRKDINYEAIITFLGLGYIPSPLTPFKHIKKLAASNFLIYKHGVSITESKLFDFENFTKFNSNFNISLEEAKTHYSNLIQNAINIRTKDKSTIGIIDAQGIFNQFKVNSTENKFIFNENLRNKIHYHDINILPEIIKCFEIPFNDYNLIHNFQFVKKIKENGSDYILNFNGIDYLFGTNAINIAKYFKIKDIKLLKVIRIIKRVLSLHFFDKNRKAQYYKIFINRILNIYNIDRNGFSKKELSKLFKNNFKSITYNFKNSLPINNVSFEESYKVHNYFIDIKQTLNEIDTFQINTFAQYFKMNLTYPMLDNNIYNFVKSLPIKFKINGDLNSIAKNGGTPSYLHHEIFSSKNYKPEYYYHVNLTNYLYDINLRKKIFNYLLNSDASKVLFNSNFLSEFFNAFEKSIISKKRNNKILYNLSFQLFNLLILTNWWDQFISNKKGKTLFEYM